MKWLKRLGILVTIVLVLLAAWVVGGSAYALRRERAAEQEWARRVGPLDRLSAMFPPQATNDAAYGVEKRTQRLGFALTAPTGRRVPEVPAREPRELDVAMTAVSDYLTAELRKPDAAIASPPEKARDYLASHDADIRAIEADLRSGEVPRWETDISRLYLAPLPNLLGQLRLHRVLLAIALDRARRGDAAASEAVEASWRLNQSVRDRPELISQLIAVAVARLQVGALRKLDVDAAAWRARLFEHDWRRSMLRAYEVEARMFPETLKSGELPPEDPLARLRLAAIERPYLRLCSAEHLEAMADFIAAARAEPVTDGGAEALEARAMSHLSKWNILSRIGMPHVGNAWRRVDRLLMDLELTDKVLQARAARAASGGKWPAEIPGINKSAYPGAGWTYSVTPEGRMSLSFSKVLPWPGQIGAILLLEFRAD